MGLGGFVEKACGLVETAQHELLKNAAASGLDVLSGNFAGRWALERYGQTSELMAAEDLGRLCVEAAGIKFEHQLVAGAGWDKTGKAAQGLNLLGFAGVEVGTVTLNPQPGNPRPRLWTIDDEHSVGLNRLGFNSPGAKAVALHLERRAPFSFPLGINIGKNKRVPNEQAAEVHAAIIPFLLPHARWITVNVSSPNTKDLRLLQEQDMLAAIITAVQAAMDEYGGRKPLFVKIAPDLDLPQIHDIVDIAIELKCAGIVAANTTVNRSIKAKYGERWANEAGGLSGADSAYEQLVNWVISTVHKRAGEKLLIMGVGGARDTASVLRKIDAGATLVQIVTGIRQSRGRVVGQVLPGLLKEVKRLGIQNVSELVGRGRLSDYPRPQFFGS